MEKSPNKKVIGKRCVCAIKRYEYGKIEQFKARLGVLGYRQTYGVDYHETYSPVANISSIRIFLAVCCHFGMIIRQYDVDTAFLNDILEEDVYISAPQCVDMDASQVLKLNRSLYGLNESAATWFKTVTSVFRKMGFVSFISDSCVFVRHDGNHLWF